ncbi:MAG: hypothetical protein IJV65_07480 [Kiritimatiellae bacterium]|nr:hypothetical protein [Kiritimatiellia bacterium]
MKRQILLVSLLALAAGCAREETPAPVRGALLVTVEGPVGAAAAAFFVPPGSGAAGFAAPVRPVSTDVLPAAASALTGLLPPQHGLRVDGVGALDPAVPTLATRFAEKGWACAAFLGDPALSSVHGLDLGFSVYSAAIDPTNRATGFLPDGDALAAKALDWLDRLPAGRQAFVWLHLAPRQFAAGPDEPAAAELGAAALVAGRFSADSPVVVLPLAAARGAVSALPDAGADGAWCVGRAPAREMRGGVSAADAPLLFGFAGEPAPDYCESVAPWYAFRLPPLERRGGDCAVSVLDGLDAEPVPMPLAHQNEMAVLRANGHLGEGLVPPYTNGVALAAPDEAGIARLARWREAVSAPATNRVAALRALAESDPDVPLFRQELGEALMREKDLTGACNELAAASRLGWNMVLACRLQARCHAAIGNVPAAIDAAETAFLANEGDGLPRRELSDLLLRTGAALLRVRELVSARDCIARSVLLEPGRPDALLLSAELDLAAGHTNLAVRTLDDLAAAHPRFKAAAALRAKLRGKGAK